MGNKIPDEEPIILPDEIYKVTVRCHQDMTPVEDCSQTYVDTVSCCVSGQDIITFIYGGYECKAGYELCTFSGYTAQHVIDIKGPFIDYDACDLDI